jgi:hypothetical protein
MEIMSFETSNKLPPSATVKYTINWIYFHKNESSPWYGVKHMLCTFHLVEQQFDNDVLNLEDREGIVYQVNKWIRSFTYYCESEDEYKLSYKLLIEFMNRPDVFESMGPNIF